MKSCFLNLNVKSKCFFMFEFHNNWIFFFFALIKSVSALIKSTFSHIVMFNNSNLSDKCYVCNISNYTNWMLETSTYLTRGISLPKVFPTLQSRGHCPTKAQESYVATKNSREKMSKWFHINLAKTNEQLIFRFAKVECT